MAFGRGGGNGSERLADWLFFRDRRARSNGHGWWRSVWGTVVQDEEKADEDESK